MDAYNNAREVSGGLSRVDQFGSATENLFSRLYKGLTRRVRQQRRAELQQKIDKARRVNEQNKQLQATLAARIGEIERLHGILSGLEQGIIMQDTEGRLVYINTAARELLGTQKNFWESELGILFDNYRDIDPLDSELVPLGEPSRVQVNNRVLRANLAAVANNRGERLGTMVILSDVTRDAVTERLKDQFVTSISHELNTPMTVIKAAGEVLSSTPEDQPANRRMLQTLTRNIDTLSEMVDELLSASEMGAGIFDVRREVLDLEELLLRVVDSKEEALKKNKMEVVIMVRDLEHIEVRGDDQHLQWAFRHLLQNAINYSERGGHILIVICVDASNPNNALVQFMDRGVGITDKDLPHIFERFYRGEARTSDGRLLDPRGLGQGLFVARTVAQAHGGFLSVESNIGEGSLFTVALPLASD